VADYLGRTARIVGVDIDERCKGLDLPGSEAVIGDQADPAFHRALREQLGPVDVVIDDGGHTMDQQLTTFREMWPAVRAGGVYLVEDLHTSYWSEFGGGYRKPGPFIEYAKTLVYSMHAWHSRDEHSFKIDDHTRTVRGMHVYDSVIVFDKAQVEKPDHLETGRATFEWGDPSRTP